MDGCRFCEMISGGYADLDEFERDDLTSCVLFKPLCGTTSGHMLAVPVRHVERADDDPEVLGQAMTAAARYAHRNAIGDFNLIQSNGKAATQGTPHIHVHIVPRVSGDGKGRTWPWTDKPTHLDPGTGRQGCRCGGA